MTNRNMAEIVKRQNPATLPMTATVQEACRIMRDRRIGAILVTGRDIVGRVAAEARDPATTELGAVMTASPDTVGPKAHAIDALRMMRDGGYRHVPILDGTTIVGIVSHGDFEGLERARLDTETGLWEVL